MSGLGLGLVIRPLGQAEIRPAAKLLFRSANLAYRDINWNHTEQETLDWFEATQDRWSEIWVAACGGQLAGVMCLETDFIDQLFIDPDWQRKGIGSELLERAKQSYPNGFKLFVFQNNEPAVNFYERHGLVRGKAGVSPDEGEPDFEYFWRTQNLTE